MEDLIEIHDLIEGLLAAHRSEIESRRLIIRRDIEPGLGIAAHEGLGEAIDAVLGFALSTLPDDCELYLAAMRSTERLASVGRCEFHLRWQVLGQQVDDHGIARIRPRAGCSESHLESRSAERLRARFEHVGLRLALDSSEDGREIRARVEVSATPGGSREKDTTV